MKKHSFFLSFLILFAQNIYRAQDIFEAARKGDVSRMEFLVKINIDTINKVNESGFSPLIIACYRNQLKAVEFLLASGVNVNMQSPEGSALLGTCYKGSVELARTLINNKADVNAQNEQGTSALMFAVLSNNIDLVKLLLESGARKDLKEKSGKTALDYAKANQFTEIIRLLGG